VLDMFSAFTVTAGQTVDIQIADIDPTHTTLAVDFTAFVIEFTPTASTL
jgi:hypothetical protein